VKGLSRLMVGLVAVAAVVLAIVVFGNFLGAGGDQQPVAQQQQQQAPAAPAPAEAAEPPQPKQALRTTAVPADGMVPDMVLGDPDAPVTIIEYSSLTCPHCAAFHRETLPKIKDEFIATGKAKLVYRDFPFDNLALGGAMLTRCVPTDRYFSFLETLFASQQQWAYSKNPLGALANIAKLAGIPDDKFQACLTDQQMLEGIKAKQEQGKQKYDINSTPSFVVGGEKIVGNQPYETFAEAIRQAQ